jgi:hypothetical protein
VRIICEHFKDRVLFSTNCYKEKKIKIPGFISGIPISNLHWGCAPHCSRLGVPQPHQSCVLKPWKPELGRSKGATLKCHWFLPETEVRAEGYRILP